MSRADQHLQHSVMGMLGSFWSRVATERTKGEVRAVATLAANAPALRRLDMPMQKLIRERQSTVENIRVPFLDGDFVVVGPELAKVWRTSLQLADGSALKIVRRDLSVTTPKSQVLIGSSGRPLGAHNGFLLTVTAAEEGLTGSEMLYVLPLPDRLTPIVIATKFQDRVLVQGIDFETGPNYIILRESPGDLFAAGGFTVLTGLWRNGMPYDFTMQVNGDTYGSTFIASYYRGSGSVTSFERAAAQACGLLVLEVDDTLVDSQLVNPGVRRYTFLKSGVFDVDYPHKTLTPGTDYARGHIVSNGFRIATGGATGWLRRTVGTRAVILDGAMTVRGLYLMPEMVTAYHTETGVGGMPHARVQFRATETALLAAWSLQKNHELTHGAYLSTAINMTADLPKVAFDMHQMLEDFYKSRLMLLLPEFDGFPASFTNRLLEFVAREKPMGACVLVAANPSDDIPASGSIQPSTTLDGLYGYGAVTGFETSGGLSYAGEFLGYYNEVLAYH